MNSNINDGLLPLNFLNSALVVVAFILAAAMFIAPSVASSQSQDSSLTATTPDSYGQNKAPGSTTDQQSNRKSDRNITRQIRQSVVADKSLSMYAHNVNIITRHGVVTLKGPVKSDDEKQSIASKAEAVVGSGSMVKDELTVDTANN
jgi:hyperosmotically inducible protein